MSTIRKDFKHGDIYVTTSGRDALCNGIANRNSINIYKQNYTKGHNMIEVIKHGKKQKSNRITTRCDECGCVFSFVDKDLYLGGDLCHSRELCEDYVCCPDCNNKIVVHNTSCFDNYDVICEIVDSEIENEQ